MKNLKMAVAALVIAAGSIGAFAFTKANDNEVSKKELQTYYYGNNGDGSYRQLSNPSGGSCTTPNANPCIITSSQNLPDGFDYSDKPSDAVESSERRVHVD